MKIKRFLAADLRTAFRMVREEHGPDAVILSNRRTEAGVEVVAASHYDLDLLQRTLASAGDDDGIPTSAAATSPADAMIAAISTRQPGSGSGGDPTRAAGGRTAPTSALTSSRHSALAAAATDRTGAPTPVRVNASTAASAPAAQDEAELRQLRQELALMRQMIEREMSRLSDERLRGSPVRAQALELMDDYGFDAGIGRDVALQIPIETPPHKGRGLMLGLLSKRLPIAPIEPLQAGGVIALVGPTGAGKTTTIAKLAARFVAEYGPREVALVTTDTLRVGGREQLHGHGRRLGVCVHEADSGQALIALLERLRDYRLVLVDTAGMGQRDHALTAQLQWLRAAGQITTLLVLPANAHFADLDEVTRRFAGAAAHGVVLTKLDETGRLGSVLSVVVDHQLPITWVTDGQRVPEDLHRANAANLVLRLEDLRRAADKPCIPEPAHAVA